MWNGMKSIELCCSIADLEISLISICEKPVANQTIAAK